MRRGGVYLGWILGLACSSAFAQDWRTDVGYVSLQARLGGSIPTGAGITITQIEGTEAGGAYSANPALGEFSGKTITQECGGCNNAVFSSHATTVGTYLYGNVNSIAPGITTIGANEINNWLNTAIEFGTSAPATDARRLQNHAWAASTGDAADDNDINRRLDLMLYRDGVIASVGVLNTSASAVPALLASSYNAIATGRSSGVSSWGPVVPGLDGAGRVKPDIVVPVTATSWATGVISGASALLLQTADDLNILSTLSTTQRKRGKAMLAKALIMAGATKSESEFISHLNGPWRKGFASPSTNGTVPLDYRFGAGELNIDNSHRILTANPQQAASGSSLRTLTGWNFTTINGGTTQQYFFEVPTGSYISVLSCLLAWDRRVNQAGANLTPGLANLDLRLFEATGFTKGAQRDLSVSTLDNIEHIWLTNLTAGRYVFEVTAASPLPLSATNWEYAIAWDVQTSPATLPPDLDHDGDVDSDDLAIFVPCRTRSNVPRTPACSVADFNNDNDVDPNDFATWQRCRSGKGIVAPATCYLP